MEGLTPSAEAFVPRSYQAYNEQEEEHPVEYETLNERLISRSCDPLPQGRSLGESQLPVELRAHFADNLRHTLAHLKPSDPRNKEVPKPFYCVNPLDNESKKRGAAGSCGYPTSLFKVVSRNDGLVYALRRVDNVRGGIALNEQCQAGLQLWRRVLHANVVPLRQAFIHQRAVFLVHDFWPGAKSILDIIEARGTGNIFPEKILWSLFTQMLTGLRAVHDMKVSFHGGLSPSSILITKSRARLAGAGIVEVLEGPSKNRIEDSIREDITALAKTMLVVCCMNAQALSNPQASLDFVRSRYSMDILKLVTLPLQRPCDVYDLLALCSHGLLAEVNDLYSHVDSLEENLCRQIETSRINRLMIKMNLVNERPEYGKSEASAWAETGDRYILKLFRNYVFHQTDEQGQPWLDVGHIMTSLNKLDLATDEKILLTSTRSILVVTFADVRKCLDDAFQELMDGHRSVQFYDMKQANPNQTRPPEHLLSQGFQNNPYSAQVGYHQPSQDAFYPPYQQHGAY